MADISCLENSELWVICTTGLIVGKLSEYAFCTGIRKTANQNTVSKIKCFDWMILEYE